MLCDSEADDIWNETNARNCRRLLRVVKISFKENNYEKDDVSSSIGREFIM